MTPERSSLDLEGMPSLKSWGRPPDSAASMKKGVSVDCGWGRVIFGQTFDDAAEVTAALLAEPPGRRDVALYLREPHVVLSLAPQALFLDPSHTFRLVFGRYAPTGTPFRGFRIRPLRDLGDAEAINRIYRSCRMVTAHAGFFAGVPASGAVTLLVAEDEATGAVIGAVTGIDHVAAFDDADNGASLWSLAVDSQARPAGVGEALARALIEHFTERGRSFLDLSVMHDNEPAIALYEKLGFVQVPVFCVKRKNEINERLFIGPMTDERRLNVYARVIVDEARRRGIGVDVVDAEAGYFTLTLGGRSVTCRESLSELTTAVAMSRCDDKAVTLRLLASAGLAVPEQVTTADPEEVKAFLAEHGSVVVKPARGEQGVGISVDMRTPEEVERAVAEARKFCDRVLVERFVTGDDLRVIVIDNRVVAGAVRKPARVTGDGKRTMRELIERQSRRRARATHGESRIPMDGGTERAVRLAGYGMDDVPEAGVEIAVRKTANLHTGGTIHDVTDMLHPRVVDAAIRSAQVLDIPLVGLDLLVPALSGPEYVVIEANERPGLANHEPQPTVQRFIDLLFPQTRSVSPAV